MQVYYTYSEGFKSGSGELTISPNPIIGPETIRAHEIGFKSQLFDNRVTFNIAAFTNTLLGLQVNRTIFDPVAGFLTVYENATKTKAKGIEVDLSFRPSSLFRIDLSGAYLDSEFDNFRANDPLDPRNVQGSPVFAPVNVDLTGNATRYSPKWAFNIHPELATEFDNGGRLIGSLDFAYKSRQFHTEFNRPENSTPGYMLINGSIRYTSPDRAISAELFVENLTDELVEAGTFAVSTSRSIGRTFLPPRVFGATLGYKF
jgi:iron complex outermembrane receptor protein